MKINVVNDGAAPLSQELRGASTAIDDLLFIYHDRKMFMNQKGYLQKLVELLYELGYYENNKSLFLTQ